MKYERMVAELKMQLAEVPEMHHDLVARFAELTDAGYFRAAYDPLHELCHLSDWSPSTRLRSLIHSYLAVF